MEVQSRKKWLVSLFSDRFLEREQIRNWQPSCFTFGIQAKISRGWAGISTPQNGALRPLSWSGLGMVLGVGCWDYSSCGEKKEQLLQQELFFPKWRFQPLVQSYSPKNKVEFKIRFYAYGSRRNYGKCRWRFSLELVVKEQNSSSDLKIEKGLLKYPSCSFSRNIQLMYFISTVPLCFVVSWECQKPTYQRTSPKTKISHFLAAFDILYSAAGCAQYVLFSNLLCKVRHRATVLPVVCFLKNSYNQNFQFFIPLKLLEQGTEALLKLKSILFPFENDAFQMWFILYLCLSIRRETHPDLSYNDLLNF